MTRDPFAQEGKRAARTRDPFAQEGKRAARTRDPFAAKAEKTKAIETYYAGCRFRSRLEARWAVFFDALGIEWEYEPQGFRTPDGPYLPDFNLPNGPWVEIKGPEPSQNDLDRCRHIPELIILVGNIPRVPEDLYWRDWHAPDTPSGYHCPVEPHWDIRGYGEYWPFGSNPRTVTDEQALTAARSARFEHGERG